MLLNSSMFYEMSLKNHLALVPTCVNDDKMNFNENKFLQEQNRGIEQYNIIYSSSFHTKNCNHFYRYEQLNISAIQKKP